jgi:hypothetical protein
MKIISNSLHVEYSELLECGIPRRTILSWSNAKDPEDSRKVLVPFDSLKEKYKALVQAKYGDPYEYTAKTPIKRLLKKDFEAEKFYLQYRFDNGKALPQAYVDQYTQAASWLNMIRAALSDKQFIKRHLQLTLEQFWTSVIQLIEADQIDLPFSDRRLRERIRQYGEEGYGCLVSAKFGNRNSSKITDELSEALLLEMIAHPNQFDDVAIAWQYNIKAQERQSDTISPATVGNYRRKYEYLLMGSREGNKLWADKFAKNIPGMRPSAPMLLLNSDDNHLDLFYIDPEDSSGSKYYRRNKLIVVIDTYNDYVLGYAAAPEVSNALVKAAYLDAMYHIKELTGKWYLPHQIMTDRWGKKELEPFYKRLAHYFPATTGLARAKYIEQSFAHTWHSQLKWYNNYSGHNISAKSRGVNQEALVARKKDFPTVDEAHLQISDFINRLRLLPGKNEKLTRKEEWILAFQENAKCQAKCISDEEMLYKLGSTHEYTNTITKAGIRVTVNGKTFLYDIPEIHYLQNVGKKVQVIYDPRDLSRVLVTDGDKLRFVAPHHRAMPRALADYEPGDRSRLNEAFDQKLKHVELIGEAAANRKKVLSRAGIDPEGLLQANVLVKEIKQQAEENYLLNHIDPPEAETDLWDSI